MTYNAKILADSISFTGKQLTTMEITFPRCVLAEFNTHRMFSRNSASSRAIPIEKMLERVKNNPFIPEQWGKPAKGMGAKEYWPRNSPNDARLTNGTCFLLKEVTDFVERYKDIGNKEDLNRYLEPFMWHTAIITSTEWDNFFKLRTNEGADWKIRKIADMMYDVYHDSSREPKYLGISDWHLPLIDFEDRVLINKLAIKQQNEMEGIGDLDKAVLEYEKEVSVARCARVSYLTHDGKRDIEEDLKLFDKLKTSGHWSPFEHVATPYFERLGVSNYMTKGVEPNLIKKLDDGIYADKRCGNFIGWKQFRKEFADENCTNFRKEII